MPALVPVVPLANRTITPLLNRFVHLDLDVEAPAPALDLADVEQIGGRASPRLRA
jgi:hypothetical protein